MKFEIKPSFRENIQSLPLSYKNIVKDIADYLITILEDQRERNKTLSCNVLQLQNLFDEYWYLSKELRVHYIIKKLEDTFEKIEFTKTLEIKILFLWNNDIVSFLMSGFSLVQVNKTTPLDDIVSNRNSFKDFGLRDIKPIERNITFVHHQFTEILEIIDHCDFPSYYLRRYFLGMRAANILHSAEYYWKPRPEYNFDPRDDLFIKSACPSDNEIRKYFNKKESVLMVKADVEERCWFLSKSGFSDKLSGLFQLKK
jgi:hypothetical protein